MSKNNRKGTAMSNLKDTTENGKNQDYNRLISEIIEGMSEEDKRKIYSFAYTIKKLRFERS